MENGFAIAFTSIGTKTIRKLLMRILPLIVLLFICSAKRIVVYSEVTVQKLDDVVNC